MATGVPLVTTRAGQAPDLVVDGVERQPRRRRRPRRARGRPAAASSATRPLADRVPRRRARDGRGELARRASRRAGARCSRASRSARVDSERAVARYGRAASRWARLLASGRAEPGLRVFYGWDGSPAPGEPVAGGTAKLQKLAARWPNRPTDFSLLYLGTTYLPARPPAAPLARAAASGADRRQPGRSRVPGLGRATRPTSSTCRSGAPCSPPTTSSTRARSASAPPTRSSASRAARGRSSRTPSTSTTSPRARCRRTGRSSCSAATRRRRTGSSSGSRRSATCCDEHPDARLLVAGRLVSDPEPTLARLGLGGRRRVRRPLRAGARRPAIVRRAHVLLHTKVNDPCPTAVIEAMACGVPVAYPASGGTVELVGDEAGVGVPHPDGFERDEPPAPEALAAAVSAVLADRDRLRGAARARARSSGSRSPTGSSATRRSSPSLVAARVPRSPRSRPASVAAWNRARVPSSSTSERDRRRGTGARASARSSARGIARSGRGRSRHSPPSRRPSATSSSGRHAA